MKQTVVWKRLKKIVIIILGALLSAVAINLFLIPANVYASGVTGAAQLIARMLTEFTSYSISTGSLLLILNIPVAILGWLKVGRSFTLYSFISVALTSLLLELIPVGAQATDTMLYAVFGGVVIAIGIGITLRVGASTGGLDIIAMVLSRMNDQPVGKYFFSLNAIIIITAGLLYGWDKALYTLISVYASKLVIDAIHTSNEKLTALIVTKKADTLKKAIHSRLVRGITVVPATGAFSNEQRALMMTVITRYELYELEHIVKEVDPNAFTNIVQTTKVYGFFRKESSE